MSVPFYETRIGRQVIDRDLPALVRQLTRIADALERLSTPPDEGRETKGIRRDRPD